MEVETRYSNDIYQQFGVTLPTDSSRYVLTNIYGFLLMYWRVMYQRVKVPARPVSHVMSERLDSYFSTFFKLKSSYSFMLILAKKFYF